jgi:hypothetical protein
MDAPEFVLQHARGNRSARLLGIVRFARKAPQFAKTAEHETEVQPIVHNKSTRHEP